MYLPNAPFSNIPSSQTIKVTHLDKIPIRFFLDKKSQSFQLKFNKLNGQKNYSKIEFDFENNLIFIECQPDPPATSPKIFSISFPPEFEARKESLSSEHFDWEATSTQIVISYKCPPQVIVIDENFQPPPKPNVITIDDTEEIFPKSKGIKIINDIAEIENALQVRYMDRDSKRRYQNRLKNVMNTVEDEFAHSISLKKGQIKKLAHQLIEKNFDSYEKAQENGYSFDVSSNKLYINKDLPDLHQNFDDPNEFNEIKDVNTMEAALQDLDEAVKFPKKKKEKNIVDVMRLQKNERLWNEYLEQNGADERELGLEDETELFEDYEIKKKNSVYIVNEPKYKSTRIGDRQKFRFDEEPLNEGIRKKFKVNGVNGHSEEKSIFYNHNRNEETYAINENKFKKLMSQNFRNGEEEENGNFNGEKLKRLSYNNNNNNQSFRKNYDEDEEEPKFHFNGRLLSQLLNNNNNNPIANNHINNISNNKFRNNGDEDEPKIKQNLKRKRNTFLNFDEDDGEQYL